MDADPSEAREIRAARNQSLFRAVNEKIVELDAESAGDDLAFVLSCECADVTCVQALEINAADYRKMRANPRRFVVLSGHVYPDVENVVAESSGYMIVEKIGDAAGFVEQIFAVSTNGSVSGLAQAAD